MFCFMLRASLCKLETASQNVDDVVNSINTHSIFRQTSYLNAVTAVAAQTKNIHVNVYYAINAQLIQ